MRTCIAFATAVLAAAVAATGAAASVDPSISVKPRKLTLGETATIRGTSWVVGAGCSNRVVVRIRIAGATARVGSDRVDPSTGAVRLRFTPPQSRFPTGRARLIARQSCPDDQGGDLVRRTGLRLVD